MKAQSYDVSYEGQKSLMPTEHESMLWWGLWSLFFPYISCAAVLLAEANGFGNIHSLNLPEIIFLKSISNNKCFSWEKSSFSHTIIFSENTLLCLGYYIFPSSPKHCTQNINLINCILCISVSIVFPWWVYTSIEKPCCRCPSAPPNTALLPLPLFWSRGTFQPVWFPSQ